MSERRSELQGIVGDVVKERVIEMTMDKASGSLKKWDSEWANIGCKEVLTPPAYFTGY
jgi:hypothetical protein